MIQSTRASCKEFLMVGFYSYLSGGKRNNGEYGNPRFAMEICTTNIAVGEKREHDTPRSRS